MGGKDIWHYIDHNTQQVLPGLWKYGDHILNTFQSLGKGPWLFTFISLTLESRLCVFLCVCLYEYFEYHSICMCVYLLVCIVCLYSVFVCMHVPMYVGVYVSVCSCINVSLCMSVSIHVSVYVWIYVSVCLCAPMQMCVCVYMCLCACTSVPQKILELQFMSKYQRNQISWQNRFCCYWSPLLELQHWLYGFGQNAVV